MTSAERWETRQRLLSRAAGWLASYHHFEAQPSPGMHDDAEMELKEDGLLAAARAFVKAHEDVKLPDYMESQ